MAVDWPPVNEPQTAECDFHSPSSPHLSSAAAGNLFSLRLYLSVVHCCTAILPQNQFHSDATEHFLLFRFSLGPCGTPGWFSDRKLLCGSACDRVLSRGCFCLHSPPVSQLIGFHQCLSWCNNRRRQWIPPSPKTRRSAGCLVGAAVSREWMFIWIRLLVRWRKAIETLDRRNANHVETYISLVLSIKLVNQHLLGTVNDEKRREAWSNFCQNGKKIRHRKLNLHRHEENTLLLVKTKHLHSYYLI